MMDKKKIPENLHHLIPIVEKWGIGDDYDREIKISQSANNELIELVESVCENEKNIFKWFCYDDMADTMSEEYSKYTCYTMAFDSAKKELEKRNKA